MARGSNTAVDSILYGETPRRFIPVSHEMFKIQNSILDHPRNLFKTGDIVFKRMEPDVIGVVFWAADQECCDVRWEQGGYTQERSLDLREYDNSELSNKLLDLYDTIMSSYTREENSLAVGDIAEELGYHRRQCVVVQIIDEDRCEVEYEDNNREHKLVSELNVLEQANHSFLFSV